MKLQNRNLETEEIKRPTPGPEAQTEPQGKASRRTQLTVIATAAVVLAAGLVVGVVPKLRAQGKLATTTVEALPQLVNVTNLHRIGTQLELTLPGDVRAFEETRIYARADGYLLKWNTDIGAKVEAGQVLAEIDSPELDQELNQARAALGQVQADLVLARSSAERWQRLVKDNAVSQQEVDEKNSGLAAKEANIKAAEAAVSRLENLSSFKTVRAPFAGTITRRYVDTGALIRAGSGGGALFDLAEMDKLRVQINVPQAYLRDITIGSPAEVFVAEYPGRAFQGKVLRTSGAFDAATRTMLTEIEVPNPKGELFTGIHVTAQLSLAPANPPLIAPATAVIIRSDGMQVAEVDNASTIHLHKVELGRDLGKTVEIINGVTEDERLVVNPTDALLEGTKVRISEPASQKALAAATTR